MIPLFSRIKSKLGDTNDDVTVSTDVSSIAAASEDYDLELEAEQWQDILFEEVVNKLQDNKLDDIAESLLSVCKICLDDEYSESFRLKQQSVLESIKSDIDVLLGNLRTDGNDPEKLQIVDGIAKQLAQVSVQVVLNLHTTQKERLRKFLQGKNEDRERNNREKKPQETNNNNSRKQGRTNGWLGKLYMFFLQGRFRFPWHNKSAHDHGETPNPQLVYGQEETVLATYTPTQQENENNDRETLVAGTTDDSDSVNAVVRGRGRD